MDIFSYKLGKKTSGGGGSSNWLKLGYNSEPPIINEDIEYAEWYLNEWSYDSNFSDDDYLAYAPMVDTSNFTDFHNFFSNCSRLMYVPDLNTSNGIDFSQMFNVCENLTIAPNFDTSKGTNFSYMFNGCSNLWSVPSYDLSSVTENGKLYNMFKNVHYLDDKSLDNILKSCITCNYNGSKTLTELGISQSDYSRSKIQSLPSYQNFVNAGWVIGF